MRLSLILAAFLLSLQFQGCGGVEVAPSRGEAPGRGEAPTQVETPSQVETIRVLVVKGAQEVTIDGALFATPAKSAVSGKPAKSPRSDVKPGRFKIFLNPGAGVSVNDTPASLPLKFTPLPGDELIEVNGTLFRGTVEVLRAPDGRAVLVIDELPLESYLAGLINSEISSKWHPEAIKAQAVAARTYALTRKLERRGEPYHLTNTNMDQVYTGANAEDMAARSGVRETSGEALWFDGAPALTLYL
jgi:stage II sporulation protein D